jgi:UPF0755 protein
LRRPIPLVTRAAALAIILGIITFALWLHTELETLYYEAPSDETFVEIPRGLDTGKIANLLVESGILRSRFPFIVYLRFTNNAGRVKAGEYRFQGPASPKQIIERLVGGDVYYCAITIPEGLTAIETVELLAKNGLGSMEEMLSALQQTDWIADINPDAGSLEGYLFPETYHFSRKSDSTVIIKTMVEQFRKQFQRILAQSPPHAGLNVSRIVILASMIEKEVQKAEERPIVSSVFNNRLDRRMPLACDATIIYALKLSGTYDGNIRKADLSMESPYNSYLNRNLPPGPIANPGSDSLRAALNPAKTEYLYYVSRNDGTHEFSDNYSSHQRAVDRYQRSRSGR